MHSEWLSALQVGDDSPAGANKVVRCNREHVVPLAGRSPHLVVLQQVRINKHTKLSAVTKGGHATVGLGNPLVVDDNPQPDVFVKRTCMPSRRSMTPPILGSPCLVTLSPMT